MILTFKGYHRIGGKSIQKFALVEDSLVFPQQYNTEKPRGPSRYPSTLCPYSRPRHPRQMALEIRAGSLLGVDPLEDLFGIDSK